MLEIRICDKLEKFPQTEVSKGKFYLSTVNDYKRLYEDLDEFLEIYSTKSEDRYQIELKEKAKGEHVIVSRRAKKNNKDLIPDLATYKSNRNIKKSNTIHSPKKKPSQDLALFNNYSNIQKITSASCPDISNLFGNYASKNPMMLSNKLDKNNSMNNKALYKLKSQSEKISRQMTLDSVYDIEIASNMSPYQLNRNIVSRESDISRVHNQSAIITQSSVSSFDLRLKKKNLEEIAERSNEDDSDEKVKGLLKNPYSTVTIMSYIFVGSMLFFDFNIFGFDDGDKIQENLQKDEKNIWDFFD